jgi:hypothetical protein
VRTSTPIGGEGVIALIVEEKVKTPLYFELKSL